MNQEPVAYDRHHLFWPRKKYNTPVERQVRNTGAFIIKANIVDHRALHANIDPPPRLVTAEYHDLYNFIQEHNYELDGLEGLEWTIAWAGSRRLYELEENLLKQDFYLSGEYRGKTA